MIRLLGEDDRPAMQAFLHEDPYLNLYVLGNLATLGFAAESCQYWGDVRRGGALRAVLNRYRNGWVLFGVQGAEWADLARIVDDHPVRAERLQDNPGAIESFLPYLHTYYAASIDVEELMVLDGAAFRPARQPSSVTVRRGLAADLDRLSTFYSHAETMARSRDQVARPLRDTRLWLAEKEGAIMAAALTNAEISDLAMVGGVYTAPAYRGQGLSGAVCAALCAELLGEGKAPVLYWKNPVAGAVYQRLGFRTVGQWRSVRLMETGGGMARDLSKHPGIGTIARVDPSD